MKQSYLKGVGERLGHLFFIVIFLGIPVYLIGNGWYQKAQTPVCRDEPVPFKSTTIQDASIAKEQSYTKVTGINGNKHVCTKPDHSVTSDVIAPPPVDEVIVQGTYIAPPPPIYYYSSGSICRDGWHSSSTGSGACSWHGGIAY